MTDVLAGLYGRLAPGGSDRLAAAVGPAEVFTTDRSLEVGWTAPALTATAGAVSCVLKGQVEGAARLQDAVGAADPAAAIAGGYERWGAGVLDRIRGRFALVLWNAATGEGLLAVDQLGAASLYFYAENGLLSFASEIRDLLRLLPRVPAADPTFVGHYLGGEPWPQDLTPYAGIRRLPGGHAIELADAAWQVRRYWKPRYVEPLRLDRPELVAAVREQIQRAVEKRCEPGRTGILLSGGLDSTSIAALAPHEGLHAYSALFPAHDQSDETELLSEVTTTLQLPWTRVIARRASVLRESLAFLGEWQVPSPLRTSISWCRSSGRRPATVQVVVLDGEGGDELFACVGYAAADRLRRGDALGAVRLIRQLPFDGDSQSWRATYHLSRHFGKGAIPYAVHAASRGLRRAPRGGASWLSPAARTRLSETRDPWAWQRNDGPRWWAFLADTLTEGRVRFGVHDALRRVGSMAGVDRRHPLLDDLDLIELVLAIPPEAAFDARHSRPLLREAVEGVLPDRVRLRTSKADFRYLVEECFAGPEREAISSLILAPDARIRPFVTPAAVEEAVANVGRPGFAIYQAALSRMVTAECWLRSVDDPQFAQRFLERWPLAANEVEIVPAGPVSVGSAG